MSEFWFGAHKGEDIEDVPTEYLRWFLEKVDPPPKGDDRRDAFITFSSEVEDELSYREKFKR